MVSSFPYLAIFGAILIATQVQNGSGVWQRFDDNAESLKGCPDEFDAYVKLLLIDDAPEVPRDYLTAVPPNEFVSQLNSKFQTRELLAFVNIGTPALPFFVASPLPTEEAPDKYEVWGEEAARLLCYRMQSDAKFRNSYLRLATWASTNLYFAPTQYASLADLLNSATLDEALTTSSPSRWRASLEVIISGYLLNFPDTSKTELDLESIQAMAASLRTQIKDTSYQPAKRELGWEKSESGKKLGFGALPPRVEPTPVLDMPQCLKSPLASKALRELLAH